MALVYNPAPRLDRAAAGLVDATIVLTLAKVFAAQAIFSLRVAVSFNLEQSLFASLFNIVWLTFSIYLVYTVLTYRLLGRTIGQSLFALKTSSMISNRYLDQYTLVLRALLSFVSVFLVFPIISIFLNRDGKTFYDKITETVVLTTKTDVRRHNTYIPFDRLVGSSLVLLLFVCFSYVSLYLTKNTFKFASDFTQNEKVCKLLTDTHQSWIKNKFEESRIEVALALYSAGELSVDCLSKEIDFELSVQAQSATAYFAKGLISIENDSAFIRYFKKSCEADSRSSACLVATWMSFWPNFYEGEPEDINFSEHPTFVKVWSIKRHHQKGNLLRLAQILEDMSVPMGLEGFYAEHLMRVQYFTGQTKTFEDVLKIAENRNLRARNLSENYCSIAVGEGCSAFRDIKICSSLNITRETDSHLQNMYYACGGQARNIFSSNTEHEKFYLRLAKNEEHILDNLKSILFNSDNAFPIRYATLNAFFSSVANFDYLSSFKKEWESSTTKDLIWRLTGERLKSKFNSENELQLSFQVFKKMTSEFKEIQNKVDFLEEFQKEGRFPAQSTENPISLKSSKGP